MNNNQNTDRKAIKVEIDRLHRIESSVDRGIGRGIVRSSVNLKRDSTGERTSVPSESEKVSNPTSNIGRCEHRPKRWNCCRTSPQFWTTVLLVELA